MPPAAHGHPDTPVYSVVESDSDHADIGAPEPLPDEEDDDENDDEYDDDDPKGFGPRNLAALAAGSPACCFNWRLAEPEVLEGCIGEWVSVWKAAYRLREKLGAALEDNGVSRSTSCALFGDLDALVKALVIAMHRPKHPQPSFTPPAVSNFIEMRKWALPNPGPMWGVHGAPTTEVRSSTGKPAPDQARKFKKHRQASAAQAGQAGRYGAQGWAPRGGFGGGRPFSGGRHGRGRARGRH